MMSEPLTYPSEMKRAFFVKIDNILLSKELDRTRVIFAESTAELKQQIYKYYKIKQEYAKNIQLWSAPLGFKDRVRLDTLNEIPQNYECVWVRGI